jgi:pimeloyl-ACP methyl ester carboxylesterase
MINRQFALRRNFTHHLFLILALSIVMDSRGHGRSTRDSRPYGYDLMADDVEKNPTFAAFIERAGHEYEADSVTPKEYDAFVAQISKMWASQPNWTDAQLKAITASVLVVDGDHDEAIKREHTEYIASTIPRAGLLILPNASHFAFLQDPELFNYAVLHFLSDH